MHLSTLTLSLLSLSAVTLSVPTGPNGLPPVESNKLRRVLTRTALLKHADKLYSFSQQDPDNTRAFGSLGHDLTVDYLYNMFNSGELKDYYTVEKQEFVHEFSYGTTKVAAEGEGYESSYFTYSPPTKGDLKAELGAVANLGCEQSDYPDLSGKIALVSRGSCEFGFKSIGPYVPGAMISQDAGATLLADLTQGPLSVTLNVESVLENRTTHNVIAQTRGGDQNNVIVTGGHTDSVGAGPGINDDGSGTIGILEVAINLVKFSVKNAVRFCFWSAEEFGLVGSTYYIETLPAEEQDKIALYLNFDMIASPNYVYFVYDGDGSAFNVSGPPGSDAIEHLFEEHFLDVGWKTKPTAFNGRSDYGPFLEVGIPSGGLFTGAEGVKTEEEVAYYGGTVGEWYDPNYHKAGDTVKNCNVGAWITNTKGIAHAIATYATSTETIPKRAPTAGKAKREIPPKRKAHLHHSHCGHEDLLA
ncbi:hypothetical protein BDZ91DRAFT_697546 [Kalaharituber pfeilii]|nr:hypothetical protein BDZ91DRAFT_697546 [Kalaharituber pfeilii]